MLPFIAEDGLGILRVLRVVVFVFRRHQLLANANGRHFVAANSPIQDFPLARLGVEIPPIGIVDKRYGRRPVLGTDVQHGGSIRFIYQTVHFQISLHEIGTGLKVLDLVPRRDDFLSVRAQELEQGLFVFVLHGGNQGVARFFR